MAGDLPERFILPNDEPEVQTCILLGRDVRFNGTIPWVRHLLLTTVSIKSVAFLVY
jgi:hypothetical protein